MFLFLVALAFIAAASASQSLTPLDATHNKRATTSFVVAASECSESKVAEILDTKTKVTLGELITSKSNFFVMYFQTGGRYTIQKPEGAASNVIVSLYSGCGRSSDTVLALNRTDESIAFETWDYSSIVVEVITTSDRTYSVEFTVTDISSTSPSMHTLTKYSTTTTYDSGYGQRLYTGTDLHQYTTLRFDYMFELLSSLTIEASTEAGSSSFVILKNSTLPKCYSYGDTTGGFSISLDSQCLKSIVGGTPELVVALENEQYPMISDLFYVVVTGTVTNARCENAKEFTFNSLTEPSKVISVSNVPDGPFWYSMYVAGETGFINVRTTCNNLSVYTGCDLGVPDNVSYGTRKQNFMGEKYASYKIVLNECSNSINLYIDSDEQSLSSVVASGNSDSGDSGSSARVSSGGGGGSCSTSPAVISSSYDKKGRSSSSFIEGSSGSGSGNMIKDSSEYKVRNSSNMLLVIAIFIIAIIVATLAISIAISISKKNENLRREMASRDLTLAFDDYNDDDDDFNSFDDLDDSISLLRISNDERRKLHNNGSDDDSDDDIDDGSVPQ